MAVTLTHSLDSDNYVLLVDDVSVLEFSCDKEPPLQTVEELANRIQVARASHSFTLPCTLVPEEFHTFTGQLFILKNLDPLSTIRAIQSLNRKCVMCPIEETDSMYSDKKIQFFVLKSST